MAYVNSKVIEFDEIFDINKEIILVHTNKSYEQIAKVINPVQFSVELSCREKLLIVSHKKNDGGINYEIHTNRGILICSAESSDVVQKLTITSFKKSELADQNRAMKYGERFRFSRVTVVIRLTAVNIFNAYRNGNVYDANVVQDVSCADAINTIAYVFAEIGRSYETDEPILEDYEMNYGLESTLEIARNYAELASNLEEAAALEKGNVVYDDIEASEYRDNDRISYKFIISEGIDEKVFKVGVQVEIESVDGDKLNAEIISLEKESDDDPPTAIVLLFNKQIDVNQLNKVGRFHLSYSTVNRDVQVSAIEKIENGTAKAQYMNEVLGEFKPTGFDETVDTSRTVAREMAAEYPPNESQLKAIDRGIKTNDIYLVMGPPGTGKTTVILAWIKHFVFEEHKRVLISSQNNKAVDNVLARLAEENEIQKGESEEDYKKRKKIDFMRLGSEAKLQENVKDYMYENRIKNLRTNIVEKSDKHGETIDELIVQWEDYRNCLLEWKVALDTELEETRKFITDITNNLGLKINRLKGTYSDWYSMNQRKQYLANEITRLYMEITKYENENGFIKKFLMKSSYNSNIEKLNNDYMELNRLANEEFAIINEYSQEYTECFNIFWNYYQNEFHKLLSFKDEAFIAGAVTDIKPDRHPGNIWKLFEKLYGNYTKNYSTCEGLLKEVDNEIERANKIKSVLSDWKEQVENEQNYALGNIVLESLNVVGATCIGVSSQRRFSNIKFDVTIIDEAGQIQIHNALVPMSVAPKTIMLGDHKQIPPSIDQSFIDICEDNEVPTELLKKSLFEKLYEELPDTNKIILDTQYRMPAEIADTISKWFYEGKYLSPKFKMGLKSMLPTISKSPYIIIDTSEEKNRHERPITNAGCDNALEASIIKNIIEVINTSGEVSYSKIGVISAYKSQVKLIKSQINPLIGKKAANEMVASLDSFQGQERDLIMYSFTKSSEKSPKARRIGFLNELRRLNVAMTRCKKTMVLIGDMDFLSGCRNVSFDEDGNEIYEGSEKQFSAFIKQMVDDARRTGEVISYKEFISRISGDKA